jgi:hypothetical protein
MEWRREMGIVGKSLDIRIVLSQLGIDWENFEAWSRNEEGNPQHAAVQQWSANQEAAVASDLHTSTIKVG